MQSWPAAVTARASKSALAVCPGWGTADAAAGNPLGGPRESAGAWHPYRFTHARRMAPSGSRGQAACCIPPDANASYPAHASFRACWVPPVPEQNHRPAPRAADRLQDGPEAPAPPAATPSRLHSKSPRRPLGVPAPLERRFPGLYPPEHRARPDVPAPAPAETPKPAQ